MANPDTPGQQRLTGNLMILLAALGFSTKAVLVKLAYGYSAQLDAITLMTLRMLFSLPFFLVVVFWLQKRGDAPTLTRQEIGLIAVLGVMGFYLASWEPFRPGSGWVSHWCLLLQWSSHCT